MITRISAVVSAGILGFMTTSADAGSILLTTFDFGPTVYNEMEAALEANGHTVDQVDARTGGNIANALSSGSYDQVFLYDLTSSRYVNDADLNAMADFYNQHPSMVQDSRSYGLINTSPSLKPVEWQLINNVADAFDDFGGGLWIGTDHDPTWTRNANPLLSLLGFNTITGSFSQAVNTNDPESILLDGITTTDLWAQGASVGSVSLGIQPNGTDMRFHFGHDSSTFGAIPYISASFGTFEAPNEPPRPPMPPEGVIPLPATAWLMLAGIGGLASLRRKKS